MRSLMTQFSSLECHHTSFVASLNMPAANGFAAGVSLGLLLGGTFSEAAREEA